MEKLVICQAWEESERGWGTRPDGFSLHLSKEALKQFIDAYWSRMPESAPAEYSRPEGLPYTTLVDELTYEQVAASGLGLRRYERAPESAVNQL